MNTQRKKIAINGFGRIGRAAFKIALEQKNLEVVAINDLTEASILAHLLQYDTAYGHYRKSVSAKDGKLIVDGQEFPVYAEPDPKKLPWGKLGVDVVLECTGRFTDKTGATQHIELVGPAAEGTADVFVEVPHHQQIRVEVVAA